jgi:diguanylate cyclase (GGDEF)-like protein/PAS domain S-box-containing protein
MQKILIVDDNDENLYYLQALLSATGYEVTSATNGAEALDAALPDPPDLVISDLLMPVMDGFRLLRQWKTEPRLNGIPFIVYTATYTDAKDEQLALDLGADAFIVKPTEPAPFMLQIREALAKARRGDMSPAKPPASEEAVLLRQYSEVLIRKLEAKALQLEEANRTLSAREEHLRAIIENSPNCITLIASDGIVLTMNEAGLRIFEADRAEQIVGQCVYSSVAPKFCGEFRGLTQRVCRGESGMIECEVQGLKGALRWLEIHAAPLRNMATGHTMMLGIAQDITGRKQSELKLRDSEERYRATFEQAGVGIVHTSFDGRFMRCNARFAEIVGYPIEEIPGLTFQQITFPGDLGESTGMGQPVLEGAIASASWEKRYVRRDGSVVWGRVTVSLQRDGQGRPLHFIAMLHDINAHKIAEERLAAAQEALRASEVRYRTAFQLSLDSVNINRLDDGTFIDVNETFLRITGFTREEVIGRTTVELGTWVDPRDRTQLREMLQQNGNCRDWEVPIRKKNGEVFWILLSASLIELDGVCCVLSVARDTSDTRAAAEEIKNLAFFDVLTRLPNRRLLLDQLHSTAASRSHHKRALLYVDLDNFKALNETLGHEIGDSLLQEAARRFSSCVRESDTVARLGADEFAILLDNLSDTAEEAAVHAKIAAEKILNIASQPYLFEGHEYHSTSSIGITIFGNEHGIAAEILQHAEMAMFQAKEAGRNTIHFFSPAMQAAANARATLEEELRRAVKNHELLLYYQPQVSRGRLIGAEALVRWNHPVREILAPGEFIGLAEETGLILPLGDWVLETACTQIAAWAHRDETAGIVVAVNISARQFRQPDFVENVLEVLERTGANPENLKLEITESMLVDKIEEVIVRMTALRSHGLRFSLDDFGTGYSSLTYLKRMPLDQLKIDRAFVRDILVDATSGAIAQTIIALGHAMGLSVIAEGVETVEQREFLENHDCHSFQGFLFSRPLPLEQFQAFLSSSGDNPHPFSQTT